MSLVIKKTSWEDYLDPSGGSFVKVLMMGDHDAGKTRSASFWPKPIYADCEDGRMSIADRAMPYGRVRSTADMDALLEHLRKECMKAPQKREFQTLVIDTLDSYQRTVIQERLRAEKKEALSGWADWGYLDGKMTQLVEKLLNLPMNIIVNLHVKEISDGGDEDGDNSVLVRKARLKGDIKDTIFQDFDLIGQMETSYRAVKGERVLERNVRWHSEPRYPKVRDRSGKLPRFTLVDFTDQDYWRIFNAITAGVDSMPEPETVMTIETGVPDTDVAPTSPAGPDEKGGPVPVAPEVSRPKGARSGAAKKAAATQPPKAVEPETKPEPEPEPVEVPKATITESEPSKAVEPPPSGGNGKGTAEEPIVLQQRSPIANELLEEGKLRGVDHVHAADGVCIKNTFGELCDPWAPPEVAEPPADEQPSTAVDAVETAAAEEPAAAEPEPEPADDTAAAEALVADQLGGEVEERAEGQCGYQPATAKKFTDAPGGCAKDLADQNRAKVNLSLLRAHATLCESCFDAWKAAS